jgi:hypothetical protein
MPNRRRFLTLAALTGATACAGCGTTDHPTAAAGAALTCPDPTLGTVTDQQGPFTSFADVAALEKSTPDLQWQWQFLASSKAGVCARQRTALAATGQWLTRQAGETWLNTVLVGYHAIPGTTDPDNANFAPVPLPAAPFTLTIGQGLELPAGSGNAYRLSATYVPAKGSQQSATAGAATFTTVTPELVDYTYDLTFKAGRLQGHAVAPFCVVC